MSIQTQPSGSAESAAMMGSVTTVHLVLIGVLALLVIAAMLWGARQKRARKAAHAEAEARREALPHEPPAEQAPRAFEPSPAPLDASTGDAAAAPAPANATSDLSQIKGLGPKLALRLAGLGVTRIDQLAALTPDAAEALDAQLGNFRGRLARDRWIEQARLLAAGDRAGYEAEFGKL